jgi:hypothetical protein
MVSPDKLRFFNLQTSFINYFEQKWMKNSDNSNQREIFKYERNAYSHFMQAHTINI